MHDLWKSLSFYDFLTASIASGPRSGFFSCCWEFHFVSFRIVSLSILSFPMVSFFIVAISPCQSIQTLSWWFCSNCQIGWFKSGQNDKIDNLLLFRPDSESFGKWSLEKCKNFFDTTTLMPAKSVTTFYYIVHPCELEDSIKLNFS